MEKKIIDDTFQIKVDAYKWKTSAV